MLSLQIENLPPPYMGSTCVETNTEKNASFVNPLQHFDHYSYSACELNCLIEFIYDKCGCRTFLHNGTNVLSVYLVQLPDDGHLFLMFQLLNAGCSKRI